MNTAPKLHKYYMYKGKRYNLTRKKKKKHISVVLYFVKSDDTVRTLLYSTEAYTKQVNKVQETHSHV